MLVEGVAAVSANGGVFRNSSLTDWAFERVVEKGGDNPANGAKEKAEPKARTYITFNGSDSDPDAAAKDYPENNENQYNRFVHR